jgi:ankyrin repeat protein
MYKRGGSPLFIAAQQGHVEAMNVLIGSGAQVTHQTKVTERKRERELYS